MLGLQNRNNEKISVLLSLIYSTPPSAYANFARYEAAITYMEADKYKEALSLLRDLTDSATDRSFAPKSWMKTGFIYQQTNEQNKAIDAYKHVVVDYPASEDRMAALEALRSLYIQSNQPGLYTRLLKDNNLPSADSSAIDSTYYAAAEAQFANGKWEPARQAFTSYLLEYPNGIFAIKAHYYRAESNYQLKKYKEAREDYNETLSGGWNDFSENSARRAAGIAYEQKDYTGAYNYYLSLRPNISNNQSREMVYFGLMSSGFYSGRFDETVHYADTLMKLPGISAEKINDALYFKAKSLQQLNKRDEAISIYEQLSGNKNGEIAAESRYQIAWMLYQQDKLPIAETAANETIHLSGGYDYWVVKSYLLLSDILVKGNDLFNAKATLESVEKHTRIPELKQEAARKLEEIKKTEKSHSKLSEE